MDLKKLFDLTEEDNLILNDDFEKCNINKTKTIILKGNIVQKNNKCINCNKETIVKNGTYSSDILLNKFNNEKVILVLEKQRYCCKNCKQNFIPKVKFLDRKKRISNKILRNISIDSASTLSNKEIARRNFVSPNTVERIVKKFNDYLIINKKNLPKVLCVDEFRGVKNYKNKMNFIVVDGDKHKVKDLLINRQKKTLENYFRSYPKEARYKVEFFVSDMYDTYINLARKQFPNAKIIIDRFHSKRLMSNALRNKRIAVMNNYNKHTYQYRVLKKFRNLIFKKHSELSIEYKKIKYYEMFSCEYDILKYILSLDDELHNMYWLYQEFIEIFDNKKVEEFKVFIHNYYENISKDMVDALITYRNYEEYITNSLLYPYSNGVVEGINNKIKLIKRIAYGYRNFFNFRIKILLSFNLFEDLEDFKRKNKRRKYKEVLS